MYIVESPFFMFLLLSTYTKPDILSYDVIHVIHNKFNGSITFISLFLFYFKVYKFTTIQQTLLKGLFLLINSSKFYINESNKGYLYKGDSMKG